MKQSIRNLITKNFTSFTFFYRYLRYRIWILLVISILVGLLDGLGLSMFLPMLKMVADTDETIDSESMGSLSFIMDIFYATDIELNLTTVLLTMLFFFILKGIFSYVLAFLNVIYQEYFIRQMRISQINSLAEFKYDEFAKADAGRIQNTLSGEVARVAYAFKHYNSMLQQLVLVLTYGFLAFLSNAEFASLVAIGGFLTNLVFNKIYNITKSLSGEFTQRNHDFQGLLIQQVAFFKYLKATGLIKFYANKLSQKVFNMETIQRKIGVLHSIIQGVREPLMIGIVVIVILIQVNLRGGELSTIILSILFFYRALTSVSLLQTFYNSFLSLSGSLRNLEEFDNILVYGKEKTGNKEFKNFQSAIELDQLSFRYNNDIILNNINLTIGKKETIAIVGESGSGKTTLMNILSGILKPTNGKILIDGRDSNDLVMTDFQKRIGYITQEPVIFDDTIFNNVTFWAEKTSENLSRFKEATRKAHIYDFIYQNAEKEDARLGNNGVNLSGGQKQRISIARELYKEIDFLFMDEATSALDSQTERVIQENIEKLKGLYTIIIIAHRLSSVKHADRVILLNKGIIEDIGSYNELIKKSSLFKRMIELQEL